MKKLTIILLIIFVLPSMSYANQWSKDDKRLFACFIVGQTINYAQTNYVFKNKNWYEINPAMEKFSNHGSNLLEYKIISTCLIGSIANYSPKYRTKILKFSNIITFGFIHHDSYVGVKLKF